MPTWATQEADNLNRANETPLAGSYSTITGETAFNLSGNVVIPSSDAADCGARRNSRIYANDQSSSAILVSPSSGVDVGMGLSVRIAAAARTYYRFIVNVGGSSAQIRRFIAGASTALDTYASVFVSGERWTFRVSGPAHAAFLEVLRSGSVVRTFTDNSIIASGFPGISYSSTIAGCSADDWEGGELISDPGNDEIGAVGAPFWGG
jgi:hypothetical protein